MSYDKITLQTWLEAISEIAPFVVAGVSSSAVVAGAGRARSYFVRTPEAIISTKAVARLAYMFSELEWDRPQSVDLHRALLRLGERINAIHDDTVAEGPVNHLVAEKPTVDRGRNQHKYTATFRLARPWQSYFRADLLKKYQFKCVISGCDQPFALEACHIVPHADEGESHLRNGLLLRADLHRLFDNGLLAFSPSDREWRFSDEVGDHYKAMTVMPWTPEPEVLVNLEKHWKLSNLAS